MENIPSSQEREKYQPMSFGVINKYEKGGKCQTKGRKGKRNKEKKEKIGTHRVK
jgi:hypothetical protein